MALMTPRSAGAELRSFAAAPSTALASVPVPQAACDVSANFGQPI